MRITVIGAGSFGSAMSNHIARVGHDVSLWTAKAERAERINATRRNPGYLNDDVAIHERVTATSDLAQALAFAGGVVLAIPTQSVRCVLEKISGALGGSEKKLRLLNLAKGIEIESGRFLSDVTKAARPGDAYTVLSGPCHAEEVSLGFPTAVVVASRDESEALFWQEALNSSAFRVYTSDDVTGVEVGGAMKNIIAIASGVAREIQFGDNAVAALATRGLAEIMRYGASLGANPLTLAGLAGIGDLMATCYSLHSRNLRFGMAIGKGMPADEAIASIGHVVEGALTARALAPRARAAGVDLPVTDGIYRIVYENGDIETALKELLFREPKRETE